jgi:S-adenosylmethionine/arginine decarboxylase-like enzyme
MINHGQRGPENLIANMKRMWPPAEGFRISSLLKSTKGALMTQFLPFKSFINEMTGAHGLSRNSEFYFNYSDSGFVGIVCFQHGYISISTRPETGEVDLDFFLSDQMLNNINATEYLYGDTVRFFESTVVTENFESL